MGTGIWSMYFIGMLASSLPIALAYDIPTTLASLLIAIIISGFALGIANRPRISFSHLTVGPVLLGAGISAMHYVGMAAIQIRPVITYEPGCLRLGRHRHRHRPVFRRSAALLPPAQRGAPG
jgi:diguanylate cyclase